MGKLTAAQRADIVRQYTQFDAPVRELAAKFGVSRQAIYAVLKRWKVRPSRYQHADVPCAQCGKLLRITRSQARAVRNKFCDFACYREYLRTGDYVEERHRSAKARRAVDPYFYLRDTHVIHHLDGDELNNALENLVVFRHIGDFIRWQRCGKDDSGVEPIWRGAQDPGH